MAGHDHSLPSSIASQTGKPPNHSSVQLVAHQTVKMLANQTLRQITNENRNNEKKINEK
jgi:hypothetical protein